MPVRTTLIALLLLATGSTAAAAEPAWRVTEAAGKVDVRHGNAIAALRRGALLRPGDVIETAAGARAVLVRGQDYVIVAPATRLRLPVARDSRSIIQVLEDYGRAVFRIEKKDAPHFGVRTPYLVALVKGTVFTVSVDRAGAAVAVEEGRVEVATPNGTQRQLVVAGTTGTVAAATPDRLQVAASVASNAAAAADVAQASLGRQAEGGDADCGTGCSPRLDYAVGDVADAAGASDGGGSGSRSEGRPESPPGLATGRAHAAPAALASAED